jgi:hypothetical protein
MVCGEYGYDCFLVHLSMSSESTYGHFQCDFPAFCQLPRPVVIHLFSIRLDISDDFTRLHRHWCSFDSICAVSVWGEYQDLEGT